MSLDQFFALFSMVSTARGGYGCAKRYIAILLQRGFLALFDGWWCNGPRDSILQWVGKCFSVVSRSVFRALFDGVNGSVWLRLWRKISCHLLTTRDLALFYGCWCNGLRDDTTAGKLKLSAMPMDVYSMVVGLSGAGCRHGFRFGRISFCCITQNFHST